MPNVTARYWGIRRPRSGTIGIGEVDIYEATVGDATEMSALSGTSLYSSWINQSDLAPALLESMDGDLESQQTITNQAGRQFGIALDCVGQTAVRVICVRNATDVDATSFVPFAIDTVDYFVGVGFDAKASKIQRYSILKNEEIDGTFNYIYTILPVLASENPSITRGSITKGAC